MTDDDARGLGLKWRKRNNGTLVAYWVCSSAKLYAKFKPRTANLWFFLQGALRSYIAKLFADEQAQNSVSERV